MVIPKTCREKRKHAIVVYVRRNRWAHGGSEGASEKAVSCPPAAFDMHLRKVAPWFRPEDRWSRVCARLTGRIEAALRSVAATQSGLPMTYTRMTDMGQKRRTQREQI